METISDEFRLKLIEKLQSIKEQNPLYSHRALAKDLKVSHSGLFAFIHKKRPLTPLMAYRIGIFLEIDEAALYQVLVKVITN